jgi:hypothetical protein
MMNAVTMVEHHGEKLIGKMVFTYPYGEWPGGPAKVVELYPDAGAPEIVMQVRQDFKPEIARALKRDGARFRGNSWSIGVFSHEKVVLI